MYSYIQSKFGRNISNIEYEQLNKLLDTYSEQEIKKAIDDCCNKNIKNINYITQVLNNNKKNTPEWFGEEPKKEYVNEEEFIELTKMIIKFVPKEEINAWLKDKLSKTNFTKEIKNKIYLQIKGE